MGRKEILDWVNVTCSLGLTKVEETASGCAACMLLDQLHPGALNMSKVNWNAKQSFEFVGNYKLLQTAFTKLKIDRHIDVDRLISGRYMDNLEFMQWFKRFYELGNGSTERPPDYDPVEARCRGKGGKEFTKSAGVAGQEGLRRTGSAPETSAGPCVASESARADKRKVEAEKKRRTAVASEQDAPSEKPAAPKRESSTAGGGAAAAKAKGAGRLPKELPATPGSPGNAARLSSNAAIVANKALLAENQALKGQNDSLRTEMVGLEKERDFYFDKLRDIEILLQDMEEEGSLQDSAGAKSLSAKLFKILYATAEGFVQSPSAASAAAAAVSAVSLANDDNGDKGDDVGEGEGDEDLPISPMKLKYSIDDGDNAGDEDIYEAVPPPPVDADDEEDN